jgi:carboxypeptidase family protein/TonB-dependent receptor-like protein
MKFPRGRQIGPAMLLAATIALAMLTSSPSLAQVSTATIRGQVTQDATPAHGGATLEAMNKADGTTYRTTINPDGSYVLAGVAPGTYQLKLLAAGGEQTSEAITVHVGETVDVDLALPGQVGAATLESIVVVGSRFLLSAKSTEVGTTITQQQMANLPQITRNVLAFADLAPGVRFDVAQNTGQVKVQSGAQNEDNVNLFIDGVSQKNFVLRGGIAGMDSTRGNPFPQSAVAEYRVVSQNYKAEFDQVSSVAITAVTKSGTNDFHGETFIDRTSDAWTAMSPFEKKAEAAGIKRPPFHQEQFGVSLGGPIVRDQVHFFFAYEGKDITAPRQVVLQNANLLPNAGIVPSLQALQGANDAKFKENLILGKLGAQLSDDQRLEVTARIRRENDYVPEDSLLSITSNSKDRRNDETRFDVKHEWAPGRWLNEARIGYQNTLWNPHASTQTPEIRYVVSPSNTANNTKDVLLVGGSPDAQNRQQKGVYLQDDLTFTGREGHTFKGGVRLNDLTFDLSGTSRSVDVLKELIDNTTGATSVLQFDGALAPVAVNYKDKQIGLYIQDDWLLTRKLELDLGVRWDYETNMLDDNYVTPADRIAALLALDVPRYGITPPPGQTYAQSLAKGGVTITDYIANGRSRKAYMGAVQPRLGLSYDLFEDRRSVLFGGAGRAYDRTLANVALDELQHNKQPNGEIWLIRNNHKMPYTDQLTLGFRQGLGDWNSEIGVTSSYSHNQFNWFEANRDANGGWATQSPIDPLWGGPAGYGNLVVGDFITQAKTQTAYLKADKPYSRESGWGVTAVYTYSNASTTHRSWTNDLFNWTYGKPQAGWNPSIDVERHRLVVAGFTDRLIPFGVVFSSKLTIGSGLPYQITDCAAGFNQCVYVKGNGGMRKELDLGLAKDFDVSLTRLAVRADVINVLNTVNYGGYDGWAGGPGNPQNRFGGDNPNTGTPNSMALPMRTVKLSFAVRF